MARGALWRRAEVAPVHVAPPGDARRRSPAPLTPLQHGANAGASRVASLCHDGRAVGKGPKAPPRPCASGANERSCRAAGPALGATALRGPVQRSCRVCAAHIVALVAQPSLCPGPTLTRPVVVSQCSSAATPDNTYAVRTFTPPQTDLGIVQLPGVVANGDSVDMHGKAWVVSRISTQFKLQRGRYMKDGQRLYVVETSRWLLNRQLNELLEK